ncbi:MAG: selenide, water dikinase SelD [Desulfuromonas sp.]|nr:selenide, water dikinase SelD [Desulfuromonas sp.]
MLCQLPHNDDPKLLSRDIPCADAGIYQLTPDLLLLQSLDFFTPVVDDPYLFGAIAAANALSDVFAMGGQPITAMNMVCFPNCLPIDVLTQILRGGVDKVHEAGATMVGGHSIEDEEPKYGMAITGTVHPDKLITSQGCRPGDLLVLTKPLGTGLLTTALKAQVIDEQQIDDALQGMARLNRYASEAMQQCAVSACTDITGFGLIGHALEMADASQVQLVIHTQSLPDYPHARDMAATGLVPEGSFRNHRHYMPRVSGTDSQEQTNIDLLCDPQTSGGLLIAVPPPQLESLLTALNNAGDQAFVIGEVEAGTPGTMQLI